MHLTFRPPPSDPAPSSEGAASCAAPARRPIHWPRSQRRRLLFAAVYVVFLAALPWLGSRIYWRLYSGVPLASEAVVWNHYYPALRRTGVLDAQISPTDGTVDLLMLGGSTIESGWGDIEAQLSERLPREFGRPVRIFNLATISHTSRDSLLKYSRVAHKPFDVERQVRKWPEDRLPVVITADTMIVAAAPTGRLVVLGQPPPDATWPETVRHWFRTYYAGRTHTAATGFRIVGPGGQIVERVVKSLVSVTPDVDRWLEWYLATGEPRGKAGGYALQGAGSLFIERVEGSLSNVIGLPIREVFEAFQELGIDVGRRPVQ
jgi:predicted house-cleaning NTP pyrophosphatase (Maf/HAM1 superfamily)